MMKNNMSKFSLTPELNSRQNIHEDPAVETFNKTRRVDDFTTEERRELTEMTRQLRRIKRRALLLSVQEPETPLDDFRHRVLQIAQRESSSIGQSGNDGAIYDRMKLLGRSLSSSTVGTSTSDSSNSLIA